MAKIVRITRGQLRRVVVNEVQEAKLRGIVRRVLAEGTWPKKEYVDWRAKLDELLAAEGYESLSDTGAFRAISSENQVAASTAESLFTWPSTKANRLLMCSNR